MRLQYLDESALLRLAPIVDAPDGVETMRALIRLCPVLASPSRVLDRWLACSWDELLEAVFQLRMVADVLLAAPRGARHEVVTLDGWCRRFLEQRARDDADFCERFVDWCISQVWQLDPELAAAMETLRKSQQGRRGE